MSKHHPKRQPRESTVDVWHFTHFLERKIFMIFTQYNDSIFNHDLGNLSSITITLATILNNDKSIIKMGFGYKGKTDSDHHVMASALHTGI